MPDLWNLKAILIIHLYRPDTKDLACLDLFAGKASVSNGFRWGLTCGVQDKTTLLKLLNLMTQECVVDRV